MSLKLYGFRRTTTILRIARALLVEIDLFFTTMKRTKWFKGAVPLGGRYAPQQRKTHRRRLELEWARGERNEKGTAWLWRGLFGWEGWETLMPTIRKCHKLSDPFHGINCPRKRLLICAVRNHLGGRMDLFHQQFGSLVNRMGNHLSQDDFLFLWKLKVIWILSS